MIDVRVVGLADARAAGELLAATGTADVVDALLALSAVPGDQLLTSDPNDMRTLVGERGTPVTVVVVWVTSVGGPGCDRRCTAGGSTTLVKSLPALHIRP